MKCKDVSSRLSSYLDEMLDTPTTLQINEHLGSCDSCAVEFRRLALLRQKLGAMDRVEAPSYLRHLVQLRLENARHEDWRTVLRSALAYRWSRIRSLEGIWFLTRIAGTAATCVFFLVISAAMNPMSLQFRASADERVAQSSNVNMQLSMSVLKNLGLRPLEAQRRPISPSEPRINDLYLLNFGQSASMTDRRDDTFSVVTMVDRSGAAKIQGVLEYPADSRLLSEFNTMINSARCRPARQDGRAVDSRLVMTFSKVFVYD